MYDYQTLTLTNVDGSISPFANGNTGLVLLGQGAGTAPAWKTLAQANIASLTDLAGYLPLTGGTLTGALTGTTATFTGLTVSGLGSGVVKASSGALSVGNVALGSEVTGTLPVGNGGTGQSSLTANQILLGNGSSGISSITITNNDKGKLLRYTTSGTYDWVSVGDVLTLPAINQLTCANSASDNYGQNDNQRVLFRNTAYNGTPEWRLIHESDIYGAPADDLSVLANYKGSGGPSEGGTSYSNSTWVGVNGSEVTSAPKMLAAKYVGSDSNASLDFFSASELGLVTSIPTIKGLQVGEASTASKVLVGNASATGTPSWVAAAPKATVLATPRTLTIGDVGKTFDGSANVAWTREEIGYANYATQTFSGDFTENTWYRIAFSTDVQYSYATFVIRGVSGNSRTLCVFDVCLTTYANPTIRQISYSVGSNIAFNKIRIVYKSGTSGGAYLEILSNLTRSNASWYCEMYSYRGFSFLETLTTGSDESANGYSVYEYTFHKDTGSNGQFLSAVNTTTTDQTTNQVTQSVSQSWQTLTIPAAPSALPLVDNETGSLGTSGTYATADHQHPLPYAVQAAYKFYYPRKLGIGGAITAEAQEYDGTSDLILQVTEIDPAAIINTVPIEKGGTGASTASAALTNLGAAASNHNHDGTYLKLSGGSSQAMTGALYFNSALSTAIVAPGMSEGVVTVGSNGAFSSTSNVNSYVTGRRNNINLYDADVSATAGTPTDINHVAKNDTTVNIVCGSSETRAYTRYINLPTPTADMLGDTITIYFTNQKPAVTGNLWATCSTDERIMDYRYEHFKNAETTGWSNCKWANGNVVQFACIKLESTGTTYYWRAVKLVEQSW